MSVAGVARGGQFFMHPGPTSVRHWSVVSGHGRGLGALGRIGLALADAGVPRMAVAA